MYGAERCSTERGSAGVQNQDEAVGSWDSRSTMEEPGIPFKHIQILILCPQAEPVEDS